MENRAQAVGLFRYSLVREAADAALSPRQRGQWVRKLAAEAHLGPDGDRVRVSRNTLDRWIRAYRAGGFEALVPAARHVSARTPMGLLELAEALRIEEPARTASQIARVIAELNGWAPSPRTIQRHLLRAGLPFRGAEAPKAFGRFEAEGPNELWTGDALHGPAIAGHKTYLCAFIDDFSRAFVGYRWGYAEDTLRLEAALRHGLAARGIPRRLYLDNGSAMVSRQLLRACATLGIVLVHSRPGKPQGRGKIERAFRTVREQFLIELAHTDLDSLDALNALFSAWVESVYHRQVHSETGCAPLERFLSAGAPSPASPEQLKEAFLWAERRRVTKTATVSLFSNHYEVDPALVGEQIELVFDPFELTEIEVRFQGRPMGRAVPRRISRHVHPHVRHEPGPQVPKASGIAYLHLVEERRRAELARRIDYRDLDPRKAEGADQ
ncbi:MAG: DDE-type integrase/transposase/recombinase [Steroidobacteraceae bacterium]